MNLWKQESESGLTFIELLVICGIIGLLICVLGAGTTINRAGSNSFQCLNNHRQLMAAWKMYTDDNAGRLVYNHNAGDAGKNAGAECWVAGWLDFAPSVDNTNVNYLIRHDLTPYGAYLGPYAKSPSIFKCPADKSTVSFAGRRMPRVRSVSMNNFFGEGASTFGGPSTSYTLYTKLAQVKSPAALFVFADELEQSINDGCLLTQPDTPYQMIDYPAAHHDSAGAFSFADGRAEIHKWVDPRTMPPSGQPILLNVNLPGDADVIWIQQHVSELR